MKKRIAAIFLVILLMSLVLPGCAKGRINELEAQVSQLTNQVAGQKIKLAEQESQITVLSENVTKMRNQNYALEGELSEKDTQIADLEEEKAELEAENECLRVPPPEKISGKVVGTITFKETCELFRNFFPGALVAVSAFTRDPHSLVSLETLKDFLAKAPTNFFVRGENRYDSYDWAAFRLEDHWIRASLPPWSLGLVKVETDTGYGWGRRLCWRNIFFTKENGEFVFYVVVSRTDQIIKLEKADPDIRYIRIADSL